MKLHEKRIPDYPLLIILVMFWVALALQGGCAADKTAWADDVKPPPGLLAAPLCHNALICDVAVSFT